MNRRHLLIVPVAASLLVLAGCDSGSTSHVPSAKSIQSQQQRLTSQAFSQQQAAVPYPASQLRDSLERRNIRERLLRTNQPDRIQYVYLLSYDGKYLGYYAIKGKITSTQSQMTADQTELNHGSYGQSVVDAPGDDGSYGTNEPGYYFFTTEGVMVTADMPYVVSDAPLSVNAPKLNVEATQK